MTDAMRKGWCPGALRPMMTRDGLLVRLRMTGGQLEASTALALAALAEFYGNGLFDLSARANLQMRGVRESDLPALLDALTDLGLLDHDPAAEAVRNVIASPLAGLGGHLDIRPIVKAIETRLVQDTALHALPGKFGFLIDDGGEPSLAGVAADVRFDAVRDPRDELDGAWRFWIGLGGRRDDAEPLGFCGIGEVAEAAAWAGRTFLMLAEKTSAEVRRMEGLIRRLGRYQTARAFGGDGNAPRLPFAGASAKTPPVGLIPAASFPSLGVAAPYGRLDHAMLRAAANAAETHGLGELRLTPWRCLLLPGVEAQAAQDSLAAAGFILDRADARLRIAACPGRAGCEQGSTETHRDAEAFRGFVHRLEGEGIALHVSGCEKGCAHPGRAALTLTGREGYYDLVQNGTAASVPLRRGLDLEAVHALATTLKASE